MLYQRRTFTISTSDAVTVYVRRVVMHGRPYVVFKEDPQCVFKGALKAHFESIATLYHVELVMRGFSRYCQSLRFVFEKPEWTNGKVTFPAEWREVHMTQTPTGYHHGRWEVLPSEDVQFLSAALQVAPY